MTTQSFVVPVGTPVVFRPNAQPFSFCAQPGAGGTVLIDYSIDQGTTFTPAILGASTTPYSFTPGGIIVTPAGTSPLGTGVPISTIVRCTSATVAGVFTACELQPLGVAGLTGSSLIANFNQGYTSQNSTSEQNAFSMRFPPGYFPRNFRLDIYAYFTCANTANAKTIKCYFGPSANTALEGGTSLGSQLLTSTLGGVMHYSVAGKGDFQNLIGGNIGVTGAGFGTSTTANISIATANYGGPTAVEQALVISSTKATGAESLVLDGVQVYLSM